VKRMKLIKHLEIHSCIISREGGKHSLFKNTKKNKYSTVPRHPNIKESLCRKICKDLDIPDILKNK